MTVKEFETQKALGLAGEYDLTVDAGLSVSVQTIKDAVEKHTFTSRCFEEVYDDLGVTLEFEIECVHEITKLIVTELHPHFVSVKIASRNYSRLLLEGLAND